MQVLIQINAGAFYSIIIVIVIIVILILIIVIIMIIVVIIVAIIIIIVKGSSSFSPRALSSQSAFSQVQDTIHHDFDLSCFPSVQFSLIHIH